MTQDNTQGAGASNIPPGNNSLTDYEFNAIRHSLFGTLDAVQNAIKLLHRLNYANYNDWSQPLPTGRPNEVMAVLTKQVRVG